MSFLPKLPFSEAAKYLGRRGLGEKEKGESCFLTGHIANE